ncbi:MAG: hypothetical protein A2W17_05020 [Planctomycetes bacterium RBG_16_41_13]|nr:MAG: hypothetical protein A2W17_05020 [Planctomycetes bacterium RBG_16_41_13]
MSNDYREFLKLLSCHKVKYVIVGAHAVVAYSRPRATGDLDVLIEISKENAGKIVTVLKEFGFGSLDLKTDDFCKPGFVIQLGYEPNRIDILTSITGVKWAEIWKNKTRGIFGSSNIPVYFIGEKQLIKNKIATGRDQDLIDVKRLKSVKKKNKPL